MVSYASLLSLLLAIILPVVQLPLRIGYGPTTTTTDFKLASELAVVMHASASATSGTVVHQDAPSVAYVDVWKIVELTISRLADGLIDSPNITNAAANDKKLVINRNVSLTDQAPQCSRAQNQDMILAQTCNTVDFGGSEAKSQCKSMRLHLKLSHLDRSLCLFCNHLITCTDRVPQPRASAMTTRSLCARRTRHLLLLSRTWTARLSSPTGRDPVIPAVPNAVLLLAMSTPLVRRTRLPQTSALIAPVASAPAWVLGIRSKRELDADSSIARGGGLS